MTRELTCMCDGKVTVEYPETVDLAADPGREDEILDGSFMSVRCGQCGKMIKPEFPFRIADGPRGLDIYLVPSLDRGRFLLGTLEGVPAGVKRVAIGFAELQEKLRIANARLDDRVVEIAKYHLMRRAESGNPGVEVTIYFSERASGALTFDVHGLRPGEVGRVRVPEEAVDRIAADLPRNIRHDPYRAFLTGPYVSCTLVSEGEGAGEDDGGDGDREQGQDGTP
jgi:hypothetical protein